jgi:uncharacterized protein (TIGR03435 family)
MHHEMRELPVYAMVVSDGGSKLRESDPATQGNIAVARGRLDVRKVSMANVARVLSLSLNQPVLDKTSLTGRYTFHLEWDAEGDPGWSLSIAMQNELGLRLELQRGPVDVLVIDHVQRSRRIHGNFTRPAQLNEQCKLPSSLWQWWRDSPVRNLPQTSMSYR